MAWVNYWNVLEGLVRVAPEKRAALVSTVAVEPVIGYVLSQARTFDENHWDDYGILVHRPYWGPPVDGKKIAIMGDCLDNSKAGRLDTRTGQKLTVGIARSNVRGSFERQRNGSWRVSGVDFISDQKC